MDGLICPVCDRKAIRTRKYEFDNSTLYLHDLMHPDRNHSVIAGKPIVKVKAEPEETEEKVQQEKPKLVGRQVDPLPKLVGRQEATPIGESGDTSTTIMRKSALLAAEIEKEEAAPSGRVCSACGKSGHNKRTCTAGSKSEAVIDENKSAEGKRVCSECGEAGHNKRTCSGAKKKTTMVTSSPKDTPKKSGRVCSRCNKSGHNVRTCEA